MLTAEQEELLRPVRAKNHGIEAGHPIFAELYVVQERYQATANLRADSLGFGADEPTSSGL